MVWKLGAHQVPPILTDKMEEGRSLNGEDLLLDILNLMCLLKLSHRQAFIYSDTIWEVIPVI